MECQKAIEQIAYPVFCGVDPSLFFTKSISSIIKQLWEDGERKVLKNLRFLDFSYSHMRTLDCSLLPNLEKLNLTNCCHLVEFHAPIGSLS
ncbi:hypothetical protein Lser_V15G05754 [Lactuca serriola]